jgi:hypothetical protein
LSNSFTSVVDYCSKPGQFWPDGQEPPFKGRKARKRIFVTKGKFKPRKEITKNFEEIKQLKNYVPSEIFHPPTGDIELYYDYSDYSGTDEEDMFDVDEDDATPPPTVGPAPPPITVHVPVGKWVDGGDKALDPEDLDLLSEIMDIPQEVSSILPSDDLTVKDILSFKLPDIEVRSFTETAASCFSRARPNENMDLATPIPPRSWVHSLRESLDDAIRDGKRSILHPQFKDQPLPLWMLTLWEKLHTVCEAKMTWVNADAWLQQKIDDNHIWTNLHPDMNFRYSHIEMLRLPYYKRLVGRASTGLRNTLQLARFLSDDAWLSDTLIDIMIQSIARRLVPEQSNLNLVITDTELVDAICVAKPNFDSLPHTFKLLEQTLAEGKVLFFPACIPGMSHFVAFRIDFERKTLCYGRQFR